MVTTTWVKSSELNLDRFNQQALAFEVALHSTLEELGEHFGLYEVMRRCGPVTPTCLATQAGISQQAARVWLDAQAAGHYLNHCPGSGLYSLWCSWPRKAR